MSIMDIMKSLKFEHHAAELIIKGRKTSTLRIFDDKDLAVDDQVSLIDKVDLHNPDSWRSIGVARIDAIIQKRLGEVTPEEIGDDGYFSSREEILDVYRRYYGSNVTLATPVKIISFTILASEQHAKGDGLPHTEKAIVYADGASRGNPGPSAAGYAVYDDQRNLLISEGSYLGVTTNNQAEYMALKLALEQARKLDARDISVYMDSLLVVNQMRGVFKVTNRDLWPIHEAVKDLCSQFERVRFTQIPRELNKLADAAANKVLDAQQATSGM